MAKRIELSLTQSELVALTDLLDTLSSLSDGINDDGETKKQVKKIDKALLRHGYKRTFN